MTELFTRWWNNLVASAPPPTAAGAPLYPSRKIYIAARYGRKEEAETLALDLELSGHTVTSTWHKPGCLSTEWKERQIAEQDLVDLLEADTLISLVEKPRTPTRGGRHVEFGVAIALGKRVIVYGDGEGLYETVFHSLPEVEHCPAQLWVLLHTLTRPGLAEEEVAPFEYGWHHGTEHWDLEVEDPSEHDLGRQGDVKWEAIWDSSPTEVLGPEGSR